MQQSDFIKQPRGPYKFDVYHHSKPIDSPLGAFIVELMMHDSKPPDQPMLDMAQDLVTHFMTDKDRISELVYEQYLLASDDPDWLDSCDVPPGLRTNQIAPYLQARTLSVCRDLKDRTEAYSARVYMSPQWDEEHGLYFKREADGWIQTDC